MLVEHFLHDAALDTSAAPVNQADLAQSGRMRRVKVFVNHRRDIRGKERVEIQATFDRDFRNAP